MSFTEFLNVMGSRWRMIVASALLAVTAAAIVSYLTEPVYTAQARIYLSAEPVSGSGDPNFVLTTSDLDTYVSILDTPAVLDPLREELGLPPGYPIDVEASVTGATSILTMTARSSDAQEAADVANELGPQLSAVAGKFSTLLAASNNRVESTPIQPAVAPASPISPNPPRNIALALVAGLALGVGLALIRDALDTKVRTDADIKTLSDAPMLASLPLARIGAGKSLLSVENDPHGQHAEAIRRLRTNLLFVDVTTGKHSFVVTSAMPGEGKTTTAVNLAVAMADAGTKTLLIDADLRNPRVATTLGVEGSAGLTTVLLGQATPDEVIQRWGASDVHVLTAGQIPPNPSELLGSTPMQELFTRLLDEYDFVLIDSPPVVPVIDAVILEHLTGGLLMIVGSGRTKKKDLASALKQLTTVEARLSGFARNFVPSGTGTAYGYGHRAGEVDASKESRASRRKKVRSSMERTGQV